MYPWCSTECIRRLASGAAKRRQVSFCDRPVTPALCDPPVPCGGREVRGYVCVSHALWLHISLRLGRSNNTSEIVARIFRSSIILLQHHRSPCYCDEFSSSRCWPRAGTRSLLYSPQPACRVEDPLLRRICTRCGDEANDTWYSPQEWVCVLTWQQS
jgi:hypothetical protein